MPLNMVKLPTKKADLFLRVAKGHFATGHSHTNYYIDITMQKTRLSEAKALASELARSYKTSTIVDTILCLDGTEVIATCLADELTKMEIMNMNAHQTIYVVTPEEAGGQLIFRENMIPMIRGKHVLVLAASVVTGGTAIGAINAIKYYGGYIAGVAATFATVDKCEEYPVASVFNPKDLPEYATYSSHKCPLCQQGAPIDALVNSHGYSKLK